MTKNGTTTSSDLAALDRVLEASPELSATERILVVGLESRQREIQFGLARLADLNRQVQELTLQVNSMIADYNDDAKTVNVAIEEAHGLEPGAIGSTCEANAKTGRIESLTTPSNVR